MSGARPYKGYLGARVLSREAPLRSDREQLLREALAYTGGDLHRAAALVGIDRRMAERMVAENPELEEALEEARALVRSRLVSVLRPWEELAPKAQEVLEAALVAVKKDGTPDWKHRLEAAREILDRALGRPVARVEATVEEAAGPALDPDLAQRAMVVSIVRRLSAVEAVAWVRANPDEAERLFKAFATLTGEIATRGEQVLEGPGEPPNRTQS